MDHVTYLKRINYSGSVAPSVETLRRLQLAHLLSVPFENLSIHLPEPVVLDDEALFEKIVLRRRGGFCYELNGLFAALLRALGFDVQMLSAGVFNSEGELGPEFDHMTLLVTLDERWLVDVGFGDSFIEPLPLDERGESVQRSRAYRIDKVEDDFMLLQKDPDVNWKPQYRFTLQPHIYKDYAGMCNFHQTSPDSHFTKRRICSRLTADGRITLSGHRLITTRGELREEREFATDAEVADALRTHFDIVL